MSISTDQLKLAESRTQGGIENSIDFQNKTPSLEVYLKAHKPRKVTKSEQANKVW